MKRHIDKINLSTCLFWNVDTQIDFVEPEGKLYVPGAEVLKPTWKALTEFAANKGIMVVNSADFHFKESPELSSIPNFKETFPEHCMANTTGADFIAETKPLNPVIFDWDKNYNVSEFIEATTKNIVIRKDAFDVFKGNPNTSEIVINLNPETVIVYGVTTNICVNYAVVGLTSRVKKVIVLIDAIKELPGLVLPYKNWKSLGVHIIHFNELFSLL